MTETQTSNESVVYARKNHSRFIDQLGEFVSIASVSTSEKNTTEMRRAAHFLVSKFETLGFQNIKVYPPESHPILFAEYLKAGSSAPTILIYGHYDVQPPEPLEKWESGPFQPTIRGDRLYGRGSSDMKGNVMGTIFAIESLLSTTGSLPVNIKFLIEGEEEIGSTHLSEFVESHKALLACDFAMNPDSGMVDQNTPSITYGFRGIVYFELRVFGPQKDLHSGSYGGVIHNPANVLCDLLAGLMDDQNRITIPGFYDRVRPLDPDEHNALSALPIDEEFLRLHAGSDQLWGDDDYLPLERLWVRPSLDINGLYAGYTGEGSKTVLPSQAVAKLSMRLVPDQDPVEIEKLFTAYIKANAPDTIRWEIPMFSSGLPSISNRNSPWVRAFAESQELVWGRPPLFIREGGSVPAVATLQNSLNIDCVNFGCTQPGDNIHSPNEALHLPSFYRLIEALIHFFNRAGSDMGGTEKV